MSLHNPNNPYNPRKPHKWLIRTSLTTLCLVGLFTAVSLIKSGPAQTLATVTQTTQKAIEKVAPPVTPSDHLKINLARTAHGRRTIPTGKGIILAQVEGAPGNYLPNTKEQAFQGVKFLALDGPSKTSGHATYAAKQVVGKQGVAPGIKTVHNMSTKGFLGSLCLNTASDKLPNAGNRRVFTHAWIQTGKNPYFEDALRRTDYLIDQHDIIMVVGVNNGSQTTVPTLLSSAYNAIAVGTWTGNNSNGYTLPSTTGPGRCKPDVVAPSAHSSFSTPMVAGVAAMLLEKANDSDDPSASKSEVIKALILGGAERFGNFKPEKGKPLAKQIGAGRVRFDRSYLMQISGNQKPGKVKQSNAWSFNALTPNQTKEYSFNLRGKCPQIALTLVFNRRVIGKKLTHPKTKQKQWVTQAFLPNLDLSLIHTDQAGKKTTIAASASKIDNVEQIVLKDLKPGRYTIQVSRKDQYNTPWDYALTWRMD